MFPDSVTGSLTTFNENNLTLNGITSVKLPLTFGITLEPADVIIFNPQSLPALIPAAHILTPKLHFKGGHTVAAPNLALQVGNTSEWENLWRHVFLADTFGLGAQGRLNVHVGPLKTHVDVLRVFYFPG